MTCAEELKSKYGQSKEKVATLVGGGDATDSIHGIVYFSHPYGGLKDNVTRAGETANSLQKVLGDSATIISPIHNFSWMTYREAVDDKGYWEDMVHCIRLLKASDVLVLGVGWKNSLGCCVEYLYAMEHHIPVYFIDTFF